MFIGKDELQTTDFGRWVLYTSVSGTDPGRIKYWNDTWVFVVITCDRNWRNFADYTAEAIDPKKLIFI